MFRGSIKRAAVAKNSISDVKLSGAKKLATQYVQFTAASTIVCGSGATAISLALAPTLFMEGMKRSQSKTTPGQLVDGVESAAEFVAFSAKMGLAFGSAPITYPPAKAYEVARKKFGK